MSVVGVVRPVRYPPTVVGDHDEGVRQMTFGKEEQESGTTGHMTKQQNNAVEQLVPNLLLGTDLAREALSTLVRIVELLQRR